MNKEHIFPQWLIERTGTNATGIRWGAKRDVPALAATFPLCEQCNRDFGEYLEGPTARLFDEIEAGAGLSDNDAELLVRWLWKIKGLAWIADHPDGQYSSKYTLRERVLLPIDEIRGHLTLGIALNRRNTQRVWRLANGRRCSYRARRHLCIRSVLSNRGDDARCELRTPCTSAVCSISSGVGKA